jgi:hypothetical protein
VPSLTYRLSFYSAIVVTLGLPKALENWTNDQVLGFIRKMWKLWKEEGGRNASTGENGDEDDGNGPAAPSAVVAASKRALAVIGVDGAAHLVTEPYEKELSRTSPLAHTNASLLERTMSGTIRVPPIVQGLKGRGKGSSSRLAEAWSESGMDPKSPTGKRAVIGPRCDPARKERNLLWLRNHFRSLHEISRLPFNHADLWQLHQYFFSPLAATAPLGEIQRHSSKGNSEQEQLPTEERSSSEADPSLDKSTSRHKRCRAPSTPHSTPLHSEPSQRSGMDRSISYQTLNEKLVPASLHSISGHRRSIEGMCDDDDDDVDSWSSCSSEELEPSTKRARSFKPRIAFYPRIRVSTSTRLVSI